MNNLNKNVFGIHKIRAVYNTETVRCYQAFNNEIADEALKNGKFGSRFSLSRMSWIKPSFLWMMYRCNWGQRAGQERILAIDIKRTAFDYLLSQAVLTSWQEDLGMSQEEWKYKIHEADVVVQWDPERDMEGRPQESRTLQLGLRRLILKKYAQEWTQCITDISESVRQLFQMKKTDQNIQSFLPIELAYFSDVEKWTGEKRD